MVIPLQTEPTSLCLAVGQVPYIFNLLQQSMLGNTSVKQQMIMDWLVQRLSLQLVSAIPIVLLNSVQIFGPFERRFALIERPQISTL